MASTNTKEIVFEIPSWVRVFSDGTVERPRNSPIVPPCPDDPKTGVSSKNIVISHNPKISARIYLPKITNQAEKLPIYVYFHGGGFFFESAFSKLYNDHFHKLVPLVNALVISVEYRLAPETPLPASYEDCWAALQWVVSHSTNNTTYTNTEPWLMDHGDFNRVFIGGDSAGGNITHNIAMRAGAQALLGGVKILGAILVHPFFFGTNPIGAETVQGHQNNMCHSVWKLVYPSAQGGLDNPLINPLLPGAPSLAGLGCSRMIVFVAGKDGIGLRERGFTYYEAVKNSGWQGKLEYSEDEEENHVYHLLNPESEPVDQMIKRMASFIQE